MKRAPRGLGGCALVAARVAALLRGGVAARRVFALLATEATPDTAKTRGPAGAADAPSEQSRVHTQGPTAQTVARRGTDTDAASESTIDAAPDGDAVYAARRIAAGIDAGSEVHIAIAACDGPDWRLFAAAWQLSERTGAPLALTLDRIAGALSELELIRERRGVLLAGPRATIRMVSALPPLALVLGWCLGFDPFPVLLSSTGAVLGAVGAALLLAGMAWAGSLTRSLARQDRVTGCEFELAWIAVVGGASPESALRSVIDSVDLCNVEWIPFDRCCRDAALTRTLARAVDLGIPLGPLLLEEAATLRARTRAELERAAERLGVRVLVPLGVCVLPAFIVVGVLPIVITMLSGSGLIAV